MAICVSCLTDISFLIAIVLKSYAYRFGSYHAIPIPLIIHRNLVWKLPFPSKSQQYSGKCPAGYYCVGGTNTANPTDLTTHKGARCPKGSFCAEGKSAPELCPAGTYQDNEGRVYLTHEYLVETNPVIILYKVINRIFSTLYSITIRSLSADYLRVIYGCFL